MAEPLRWFDSCDAGAQYFLMHHFSFSEPYLDIQYRDSAKDISVTQPSILFNASDEPLQLGAQTLAPQKSSVFEHIVIPAAKNIVLITSEHGFSAIKQYPMRDEVMQKWSHVHDIFPLPHLQNTNLWRSPKQQIGTIAYNLWFAAAGTDCGLHNEHDFLEVHTQIWGTGHMQKFHEKNPATMYQDIYMTPGYTHEPFCGNDLQYPWHRYYADTDCIWLAVEYYG